MKILFVTFSDIEVCSSSNIRNVSLIKGLLDIGHSVDIISYKTNNKAQVRDETFLPIIEKCNVYTIEGALLSEKLSFALSNKEKVGIKTRVYNYLRKIYYGLETVDSLRKIALTANIDNLNLGEYDMMISSSNPYSVHILAQRIKDKYFKKGIKWVQYWGDALYYDTLTRHPIFPWRLKKAEYNLIKNSDAIIYTNEVVLNKQKNLFKDMKDKMSFIETPFAFVSEKEEECKYQVGYFGSFSTSVRDITPFYSVVSKADYPAIIIGNGDVTITPTKNLEAMPRATVSVVKGYEEKTRILACICNKLPPNNEETGLIPGKAYHYGATDKTILMIGASPDVKAFLEKYERYVFVDNNEEDIKKAIDDILSKPQEKCEPLKEVIPQNTANKLMTYLESLEGVEDK